MAKPSRSSREGRWLPFVSERRSSKDHAPLSDLVPASFCSYRGRLPTTAPREDTCQRRPPTCT
jgi:hypothetical protein